MKMILFGNNFKKTILCAILVPAAVVLKAVGRFGVMNREPITPQTDSNATSHLARLGNPRLTPSARSGTLPGYSAAA